MLKIIDRAAASDAAPFIESVLRDAALYVGGLAAWFTLFGVATPADFLALIRLIAPVVAVVMLIRLMTDRRRIRLARAIASVRRKEVQS